MLLELRSKKVVTVPRSICIYFVCNNGVINYSHFNAEIIITILFFYILLFKGFYFVKNSEF